MLRKIIKIDENKCDGCGLCESACHEGAIKIIGGKAKLVNESYCDGLGDCLPGCPQKAISFEMREAAAYDEAAVKAALAMSETPFSGCPGSTAKNIVNSNFSGEGVSGSALSQWPVQIKLVARNAPYFSGADVLIAADCTAYAYANFHKEFISGKVALIGCPKLDNTDYSEKLKAIFTYNHVHSVTVVRMEVPCCAGIVKACKEAIADCGKDIPLKIVTIGIHGNLM